MAIAIPSPSPRTLQRVGPLQFLVLRIDQSGPGARDFSNSEDRAAPLRLRWRAGSHALCVLLLDGFFLDASDAA